MPDLDARSTAVGSLTGPGSRYRCSSRTQVTGCRQLRAGVVFLPAQLGKQPRLSHSPIAFDRRWGNAEHLGGFFGGEAAKKAKFDDTALLFIDAGQTREGIVKSDDIGAFGFGDHEGFFENNGAVGAALGSAMMRE